jgi:hypothetical protein
MSAAEFARRNSAADVSNTRLLKSLDASGGSLFRNLIRPAMLD